MTMLVPIKIVPIKIVPVKIMPDGGYRTALPLSCHAVGRIIAAAICLVLAACSAPEVILDGERTAIIKQQDTIKVNDGARGEGAGLSAPFDVVKASHPGLNAGHAGGNITMALPFQKRWDARIGGAGSDVTDLATPVVVNDHVVAVAPSGVVTAFAIDSGKMAWQVPIDVVTDDPLPGTAGGVAVGDGRIFAHAGGRSLAAIAADSGKLIWSIKLPVALRGGPTMIGSRVLVVTDLDGNLHAYSADDGALLWERTGLPVTTLVYGAPSPAFASDTIVVAGYGGDVTALDAGSGQVIWTDTLAAVNPRTPLQGIGDITGHPVHDGGMILAVSQAGQLAAYNARSGLLIWDLPLASTQMPWIAGKTVFLVTVDGRLYAIRRSDGAVRWVTALPGALPPDVVASKNAVRYVGPFVAASQVHVIADNGRLYSFNADTGEAAGDSRVGDRVVTLPQFAKGMMFVLNNNGSLTAFD